MNAPQQFSRHDKNAWLHRLLQEPLTFIIFIWALMLVFVGLCFVLVD
jgi:hypothetical protein